MTQFRVASWNIRKAVGLDRRRDPDRILRGIAALGADIVALQEADRRLGDRPSALPADRIHAQTGLTPVSADNGRSLGWHGNAILISGRVEPGPVTCIDLPGLEPRGALMADLLHEGRPLRLIATHLGLTRRHRRRQLLSMIRLLAEQDDRPTLILGDFNEWHDSRGLEALSTGFTIHAPGKSYHAARPVAPLDRIAADPRFSLRDAGVLETALTRRASDHLPVWADFAMATHRSQGDTGEVPATMSNA
jgi:endonuclease/exonuclease/phosphatase family metal-dependent hydrolase